MSCKEIGVKQLNFAKVTIICDKVFKNGPSKICGDKLLKN